MIIKLDGSELYLNVLAVILLTAIFTVGILASIILLVCISYTLKEHIEFELYKRRRKREKQSPDYEEEGQMNDDVLNFMYRVQIESVTKEVDPRYKLFLKLFPRIYVQIYSHQIRHLFRAGFCWHFAHMLKDTFGRGHVYWEAPYSHFVWKDDDNMIYDISGVERYKSYMFLVPEECIPELWMVPFKKNRNKKGDLYYHPTVDEWMSVIDNYRNNYDHSFDYEDDFIREKINDYMVGHAKKAFDFSPYRIHNGDDQKCSA